MSPVSLSAQPQTTPVQFAGWYANKANPFFGKANADQAPTKTWATTTFSPTFGAGWVA
ncbi:MAG: hypothetical protein AB7P76_06730 [Candidatus Melainabacteria bacterium]